MRPLVSTLITAALGAGAGFAGAWFAVSPLRSAEAERVYPWGLVQMLTANELDFTAAERARIHALERDYRARRAALGDDLQATNIRLVRSLLKEDGYGPETAKAVDDVERLVGARQRDTVRYLAAVRKELTPDDRRIFDQKLVEAFSADLD